MKTNKIVKNLLYAVMVLSLLASPAMGWSIEASWGNGYYGAGYYGSNYYGYGYTGNNYYNNGYYGNNYYNPYYYGYAPTYYVQSSPDVVYTTYKNTNTEVIYVEDSKPYYPDAYVIYQYDDADYTYSQSSTQTYCGDGWCSSGESENTCPADCSSTLYCGDGACNNGETSESCWHDCETSNNNYCGDGACNNAETKYSCAEDCGLPDYCGDNSCNGAETKQTCPTDCGLAPYCGDNTCNRDETKYNCAEDCGLPAYCGDGKCNGIETEYSCSLDCGIPDCRSPSGDEGDRTCEGLEKLICLGGTWRFEKSVQCCDDSDCPSDYDCNSNRCELDDRRTTVCGDGLCHDGETPYNCPYDCGQYVQQTYCGDGLCNGAETCASCNTDCGLCYYCGDGTCNTITENQNNCATDCGSPAVHAVSISIIDECDEIERGSQGNFTLILSNGGDTTETVTLRTTGSAASWIIQPQSLTVSPSDSETWVMNVNVPETAAPGLYNVTVSAQNGEVQDETLVYVDVTLNAIEHGGITATPDAGGDTNSSAPTGAIVGAEVEIPEWVLMLAVIVVLLALLFFLAKKTAVVQTVRTKVSSNSNQSTLTP